MELWRYQNPQGGVFAFSDGSRSWVEDWGGYGGAPFDRHTTRAPFQRGMSHIVSRARERIVSLNILLRGTSRSDFLDVQADLVDLCDPELGEGELEYIAPDGAVRRLRGVFTDGLPFTTGSKIGNVARRIALEFTAGQPDWYDPEEVVISFSGTGAGLSFPMTFPMTFTPAGFALGSLSPLTYEGTVATWPVITMQGPLVKPVLHNITTGKSITFLGDVPDGGALTIDFTPGAKTWTMEGYGTVYEREPRMSVASEFWTLEPGVNELFLGGEAPALGGVAELRYYNRYKSLRGLTA